MLSGAVTVFSDSRPVISVSRLAFPLAALVIVRAATAFTGITHRLLYRYMQKTARPCGIPHAGSKKPGLSLACANIRKGGRRDKRKQAFFLACSEHTGIRCPVSARNHPLRKAQNFFRPSGTKKCYFCVTKCSSPRF